MLSEFDRFYRLVSTVFKLRMTDPEVARKVELEICRGALRDLSPDNPSLGSLPPIQVEATRAMLKGIIAGRHYDWATPYVLRRALRFREDPPAAQDCEQKEAKDGTRR